MTDGYFEGLLTEHHESGKESTTGGRSRVTINMLPDVVLLEIFDSYMDGAWIEAWHALVHVCRKWRDVVFGSPRRLNLQLYCKARTPVRKTLDVWPPLPIVINVSEHKMWNKWGVDNILAALEHYDRIRTINLFAIPSWYTEKVLEIMQQPFPALTHLWLRPMGETALVDPNSFLGGSAPRLQELILSYISFPGLPKLLLSATVLVDLSLWNIPHSGYISPEAMVNCLSMLTRLKSFVVEFESPRSRPDRTSQRPPPPTRTLLPILTELRFKGVGNYLEDFVARIDAPLLDKLWITFFYELIFDTPQLIQFISRTPKFKAHDKAHMSFDHKDVSVALPQTFDRTLRLGVSCSQTDWQLSSLAQFCSLVLPQSLILAVERLYIHSHRVWGWQDDIENSQWLELLQPFTAVKGVYISQEIAPRIAPALQELVGERVAEVLPVLETFFLEELLRHGPVQETIGPFVSARQLSNHPITISRWERKVEDYSFQGS